MRKIILLCLVCCTSLYAMATTHIVTVANFAFNPSTITMNVGDTIKWLWSNGAHTTTSTGIPAGAATWDAPLASSSPIFIYSPSVAGVYNYQCTPHAGAGMVASFTVNGPVATPIAAAPVFNIFPNPAAGVLHIGFGTAPAGQSVVIRDMSGRTVLRNNIANTAQCDIDVSGITNGFYVVSIEDGNGSPLHTQRIFINN